MLFYLILTLALISVLLDLFLLLRLRKRYSCKRWVWKLYLFHFLLIDVAITVALSLYRSASDAQGSEGMQLILWVIFLFFVSTVPKLLYVLIALLDYPVGWIRRSPSRLFSRLGLVAGVVLFGVMMWGATGGRTRVATEHITIDSAKIPQSFDHYKIVFFTDLHLGNLPANNRFLRRVVEQINRQHPDLVVCGGDLVNVDARELNDEAMRLLSGIWAKDGVYSVFGNHDLGIYMHAQSGLSPRQSFDELGVRQRLMGWQPLDNASDYIVRGGDSISVTGVNFTVGHKLNSRQQADFAGCDFEVAYRGVPDTLFNLLIAHTPEVWDEVVRQGRADLTLSGHVHAMQMKIGWGTWVWSPALWLYERWSGLYRQGDKSLYINDGIGYVLYPMRIGTPPSITVITLRANGSSGCNL